MRSLIVLIDYAFTAYSWLLIARIIMSWIQGIDWRNPMVQFIYRVTEPVLRPFRGLIPAVGGLDLSPIILFFLLEFVKGFVIRLLLSLVY